MGLESPFAYGGYGPWSNQLRRRLFGATPPLERVFVLILLLSAFPARPAAYSHHPHIASQVRAHAGATASDVAHTPAYTRGTNAAAIAAVGGLYGVAAAFFWRFCSARNYAACFACVSCGVDFGLWEPRATPARVRAAQARSGGGVQLHRGHRERGQSLGRAAIGVRSVDL